MVGKQTHIDKFAGCADVERGLTWKREHLHFASMLGIRQSQYDAQYEFAVSSLLTAAFCMQHAA